jgi:hypothetical protein
MHLTPFSPYNLTILSLGLLFYHAIVQHSSEFRNFLKVLDSTAPGSATLLHWEALLLVTSRVSTLSSKFIFLNGLPVGQSP